MSRSKLAAIILLSIFSIIFILIIIGLVIWGIYEFVVKNREDDNSNSDDSSNPDNDPSLQLCGFNGNIHVGKFPLINNIIDYNCDIAKFLLNLSLSVTGTLCGKSLIMPIGNYKYDILETIDKEGISTLCYVFWDKNNLFYIFGGTATKSQLLVDLDFVQEDTMFGNNVMCHSGFYNSYMSVRDELHRFRKIHKNKNLFISGHSLGGALSNICALDFAKHNPIHYSFASPRTGNNGFALMFNNKVKTSYRVFNTSDVVPNLPPSIILDYTYTHTGFDMPFTLNLSNRLMNHINAYLDYYQLELCYDNDETDTEITKTSSMTSYCDTTTSSYDSSNKSCNMCNSSDKHSYDLSGCDSSSSSFYEDSSSD